MKRAVLAAVAIILSASAASAAPGYGNKGFHGNFGRDHSVSRISPRERAAIANARAHLAAIRARAWRDGRLTGFERFQIRNAETRLQRLVLRSRYS